MSPSSGSNRIRIEGEAIYSDIEFRGPLMLGPLHVRSTNTDSPQESAEPQPDDPYRRLLETALDGFFQTTPDGRYIYANPALARVYGYGAPDELISELNDIGSQLYVEPGRRDAFRRELQDRHELRDFQSAIYRRDRSIRWISETASAVRDATGELLYYQGSVTDITERRNTEEALRESEARYRQMFENSLAMQWLIDPSNGRIVDANAAACAFYGYSRAEMQELALHDINMGTPQEIADIVRHIQSAGKREVEMQQRLRSGEIRDIAVFANLIEMQGQQRIYAILLDVTERKSAERQLRHQALHDTLTGLPNRLLFHDRLKGAVSRMEWRQTGIAVLFVDLDNFKVVNDSMGHDAGDVLLRTISARLQAAARGADTITRFGGDEFTLLLEHLSSLDEAKEIAERIVIAMRQPLTIGGRMCFASASVGLVYTTDAAALPDHLLRDADTAMYEAKARGKSGFMTFDAAMNASLVERMEIETDLRFAEDRGELRIHYQPLIDLKTGRLSGVEALVRWEHPARGLLMPATFIAIAEESGLIVPIGYWVLEEACRQMQSWAGMHPSMESITLNVNLSGKQLQRSDVVSRIRTILARTGLPPSQLKLEITESVLMADTEATIETLRHLKALGVLLAMDDFGTGYSSLSTLSLFPLDTVKIDRSFVKRLADQGEATSVIAAIVMLSKSLRLDITGEGVETEAQLVQLQELGCNVGQGYYFDRPLPPEEFRTRIPGQRPIAPLQSAA